MLDKRRGSRHCAQGTLEFNLKVVSEHVRNTTGEIAREGAMETSATATTERIPARLMREIQKPSRSRKSKMARCASG
jgi:hypothetical protein